MQKRQEIWQQLKGKDSCEVLILGGGINGTGLLRDLAAQVADKALNRLGKTRSVSIAERPYLGAVNYPAGEAEKQSWIERVASANNLQHNRVGDLLERYGTEAEIIASETNNTIHRGVKPENYRVMLNVLRSYGKAESK